MKKRSKGGKAVTLFVTTMLETIFAVLLANIIHQYVYWITHITPDSIVPKIDYRYGYAVSALRERPECLMWFLFLQVMYALIIFYLMIKPKAQIFAVKEIQVTDQIRIPVPSGSGQHGNERFLTDKEKKSVFDTFIYNGRNQPNKSGVVVEMYKKRGAEVVRFVGGPSSAIIIGATRSGKTRRVLLQTLWLQVMSKRSAIVSDVKGEIYYYTKPWIEKVGYKTIVIDLRNPKKSMRYNFCQSILSALKEGDRAQAIDYTWDLVSVLVGEQKGEPLWYNGETATLAAAILAVCIESSTEAYRKDIKVLVRDYLKFIKDDFEDDSETEMCSEIFSGEDDMFAIKMGIEDEAEEDTVENESAWDMEIDLMCGYFQPYFEQLQEHPTRNDDLRDRLLKLSKTDNMQYKNMTNVYYFLAYMGREDPGTGKTPLSLYLDTLPDSHPAKTVFMQGQIAAERTRSSFYTSALGTLKLFTNPNIAAMTAESDFELADIGKEQTVVYLIIPDDKLTYYPLASVMVQQIYMELVKTANQTGGRLPVPCDFDLDEVGNFPVIPVLAPMITAGQSRGVRVNLVIQDYQQLEKNYKKDFETIKANCAAKVYLKTDSPKTLKEISDYLGKYTVEVTSATASSGSGKGSEGSVSTSSNLGGRELLMPAEISHITRPYALIMNQGTYSAITKLPDLSEYRINKIWGLGDEAHNTALIAQREAERAERKNCTVELWGIWTPYQKKLEEEAMSGSVMSFLQ